nr:RHS repeat-associated core domain-containing protein [Chryseobacterium sp. LAM-KRS1]
MAPGFKTTSSTSNPFVAKIGPSTENPGGGPTDSNAGTTNPSGTTETTENRFHDTKGNIDVNGAGQLQYTLPIALPPGVKNVAPQLNLLYTSSSANGIAGYGWGLTGITSISRIGKNIEKDGKVEGVKLDYSDYYSFNGQRLILKSGEYGKDGAEYVTEKYSNIKIKSFGSYNSTGIPPTYNVSGPKYFEVTFEDGSQAWYGKDIGFNVDNPATTFLDYNIIKWQDAQGNSINYKYNQENNVAVLTSITWGGNQLINKADFNEVILNYITRDVAEESYINGARFVQNKLLKEIIVKTNGKQFKRYSIDYENNSTKYQFVKKITEFNSKDLPANPVVFNNENSPVGTNVINSNSRYDDIYGDNIITGDFNGDGKLDFLKGTTLMLGRLDGSNNFINISYEGEFLSVINTPKNNVLLDRQSFATYVYDYLNKKITINYYALNPSNILEKYNSFVLDNIPQSIFAEAPCIPAYNQNMCNSGFSVGMVGKEGDFNGDGISELLLRVEGATQCDCEDYYGSNQTRTSTSSGEAYFYVDTKTNFNKLSAYDSSLYTIGDFDGDGKSDLINLSNGSNIYSFNETSKDFELKVQSSIQIQSDGRQFGDFNGDGKMDILAPVGVDSSDWKMYVSTGKGFKEFYYSNLYLYKPTQQGAPRKNRSTLRTYSTSDLNKDGKSDLMIFESQVWFRDGWTDWNNPDSSYGFNYLRNDGVDINGKPIFSNAYNITPVELNIESETLNYSMYGEHYMPLFGSYRIAQMNTEFVIIHKTKLITWDLGGRLNVASKIQSIAQGGIQTNIEYSNLVNGIIYKSYYSTNPISYPYANILENINYNVVSKLIQGGRIQEFRYRDLIGNLAGKGMIGFRQVARSTFFANGFENTKIWSGSEINPSNEGLPFKDWSIRTTDESKIFPTDISLTNTQLLSFKQYDYKIDKLLNGAVITTVADVDKPKIVTAINPYITISKDFLKNIKTVHTVETYNDLYFPTKSTDNVNNGFAISTSEIEYYPSNLSSGSNYSIGKPKTKISTVKAYGDIKSVKEEYVYENNLLKTLKTWSRDNTGYFQETYNYDGFGNVIQKVINSSADSQTRTTKSEYDSKGRFSIKNTNNLGLETNITYNDWGQILTQTDPLGNTITNTYDNWGKLLTTKNNLEGTTTYTYELTYGISIPPTPTPVSGTKVTKYSPNGNQSITYTNLLGQTIISSSKAFGQGQFVSVDTLFDELGRKASESEPYFSTQGATLWNTFTYDDSVFPAKVTVTSFNGKQTETTISGLTTIEKELNGYQRTTIKVTDALENVISSTDKGGTINFSYNAAGEQTQAKYAENIVTTKYDAWGRKSEFNDPSNGTYKYEYDVFGQLKKTISPKGTKEFTYNNLGQLITQKEISTADAGQSTNKMISFTYDDKGRVISKSGTSKGKAYSSNVLYDPQGRLLSASENSNGRYFMQKGLTYDDKGRVVSYEKSLYSSGVLTKVQIQNMYNAWNGELYQVKDVNSGKILWELKSANAKGQVLTAKLGAADVSNTYGTNGFLTNINHSSQIKPGILQISYSFDAIKNELKSRTTGGDFNIIETFDYDDNNRLINWTDPVNGVKPQTSRNVYDIKGRILENDQVGTIKYGNSSKIYQPTGMTLNATGTQNYNNDLVQSINYNENNDPVFIDGEKGDVAFQYGLTSMRQRVTYGGNFNADMDGRFTKFYNEDGSFEIQVDNTNGKEKHVLYIAGTPYESNIIYVKSYEESTGSYKFLHKDYLGSILAISDEAGNKLEQRHFDAWGNITHFKKATKQTLTDRDLINSFIASGGLLVDRGYTSHEYFPEVGIVHMNGRLYDPLLRRFLNADENIQDPTNTQNYNKYGYVLNNPLLFNDPSGESFGLAESFIIAAAVAIFTSVATDYYLNRPINFGSMFQSVIMATISAAATFGVGSIFINSCGEATKIATSLGKVGTVIARAGAHAITQGALSFVQGGNFLSGALSGVFASVSNDLLDFAIKNVNPNSILNNKGFALLNGAVSGGVGSVLGGGNFWMGAGQGLVVTTFNYLAHKMNDPLKSQLRDEFKGTGMEAGDKATYEDYVTLTEKLPTLKNLRNKTKSVFSRNDTLVGADGQQVGNTNVIEINGTTIGTKLDYAYTLGHEMLHVFDSIYNYNIVISILGKTTLGSHGYGFYKEYRSYTWEIDMGNNINLNERLKPYIVPMNKEGVAKVYNNLIKLKNSVINP